MVIAKVWFRLLEYSPVPRDPKLVLPALLEASQISVQTSVESAHRMRRILEMLSIAEGELDVLRQLASSDASLAAGIRSRIRDHLRAARAEAVQVLRHFAPEQTEEIELDWRALSTSPERPDDL